MTGDQHPPFHLAFPVDNLEEARRFYAGLLGCPVGRESDRWIDFDFFGHQITAHLSETGNATAANPVDGDAVPVRHFGAVLPWSRWQDLAATLAGHDVDFLIPPKTRFAGQPGEQGTFFVHDPAGNALEFKSFKDPSKLFARG